MKNNPKLYKLEELKDIFSGNWELKEFNGKWLPARPLHFADLKTRLKLAWMVFIGKVDVLKWPNNQ